MGIPSVKTLKSFKVGRRLVLIGRIHYLLIMMYVLSINTGTINTMVGELVKIKRYINSKFSLYQLNYSRQKS